MKWFDSARSRLRLLFGRRAAESRMNAEFQFHIEMETDRLMRAKGLAPDEARRQALVAFGGAEQHKEELRDGRGLAWLSGLSLDLKLGGRMLLKYPGLTLAGGLAIAVAIGLGAGWYDLMGKVMAPTIPLPQGDRLVVVETQNILTNEPELRVARDFLEWRRELRTLEDLGAYRADNRNLILGNTAAERVQIAALTAAAFRAARVAPLLGRALQDADEVPGAPLVVVLGYDVWQRSFDGRQDAVGSIVKLGNTPATVIGVMPKGFAYPVNHDAWTPLSFRASYAALEGGAIDVIGRLAPGVTQEQANAELRVFGERATAALPATHEHLRPRVLRLGRLKLDVPAADLWQLVLTNLPVLLMLLIACTSVGTLIYARTALREGEIAVRSALGAGRARIMGQLFVEALVLASVAAAVGLVAADRTLTWAIERGDAPFWFTPGLELTTIVYASALAVICAAMVSLLPALKVTRARVQPHLKNLGASGATLRFGRVWTGAMIVQVALTAIGIPCAIENASHAMRRVTKRATFPSREYVVARVDLDRPFEEETAPAFEARWARTFAELERRVAEEPGVVAVTFSDSWPGSAAAGRNAEISPSAGPAFDYRFAISAVGPQFFELFDRPIVAGRAFHAGDRSPAARTVIVNEAFARGFRDRGTSGTPIGARLRYTNRSAATAPSAANASADKWYEIVGVVRDFGLDPDEEGNEGPYVYHAATQGAASPLVMSVRVRGTPATLAAHLPVIAARVDAGLLVRDAQPMDEWVRERDDGLIVTVGAQAAVTALVLFLSALGLFSLTSVSVSRRTREIGLRAALGAHPRHVLAGILSRAVVLMGSGIAAGGSLLLLAVALGLGPSGRPVQDVVLFAGHLAVTSAVMLSACLLACIQPARRALGISPFEALREA
jgi:predicted permease